MINAAPFSTCQSTPTGTYSDVHPVAEVGCAGSDVTSTVGADEVDYIKFASAADLSTWYSADVLAANGVHSGVGDCSKVALETTTKQADYCEQSFTDDSGASAKELIVVAPIAVDLNIGGSSLASACSGASSYAFMIVTSPSDQTGIGTLACNGTKDTASSFQSALQNGDIYLND
jgi:hypothetical protein